MLSNSQEGPRTTDPVLPVPYSAITIFCLGFLAFLCWYWRMDFYYYFSDDVAMLNTFRRYGWGEIWKAQNEHFMPLYKLFLYGYARLFGNNGYWLHVATVIAHGGVVFVAAYLAYVISRSWFLVGLALVLCGPNPLIWETIYFHGGFGAALVLIGWLGSLVFLFLWFQYRSQHFLILSLALLVFQSYTGGNSLFYPSLYLLLLLLSRVAVPRKVLGFVVGLQCVNLLVFFFFIWGNALHYQQQGLGSGTLWAMVKYFVFAGYVNISRIALLWNMDPWQAFPLFMWPLAIVSGVLVALSIAGVVRSPQYRHLIIFGWAQYLLFTALIAVARHSFSPMQGLSSRYIYHILPGALFIACGLYLFLLEQFPRWKTAFQVALVLPWLISWYPTNADIANKRAWVEKTYAGYYQVARYGVERPHLTITLTPLFPGSVQWKDLRDLYLWLDEEAVFANWQKQLVIAPHLQIPPDGFVEYTVR
jgi:hypothetical protein